MNDAAAAATDATSTQASSAVPALMTLTDAAAARLSALYAKNGAGKLLRIGVDTKGCSGLAYKMSWAEQVGPEDETVVDKGVTILIDRRASPFLIGSVMDYGVNGLSSGFTFSNPNEKGRCGCGSSFRV